MGLDMEYLVGCTGIGRDESGWDVELWSANDVG